MSISVIIPVWNGASVIIDCLKALFEQVDSNTEVICVDNASIDQSGALIAASFPQVRLLRQPVNLGFAGGVNAGIEAARGDVLILLNQDCIVQPGWMLSLLKAIEIKPEAILGCMLLKGDGSIDHIGARIQRPEALGIHLAEIENTESDDFLSVEYVSGAAFVLHRRVWERVGKFDEGFYPAYYEDADYCFRARRRGIEVLCVPQARVIHLRSSEEWKVNPLRFQANYHTARYRLVCKHFNESDLNQFFEAERAQVKNDRPLEETIARIIAIRRIFLYLPEIVMRRQSDLTEEVSPVLVRQINVGLGMLLQESMAHLEAITLQPLADLVFSLQRLQSFQQREYLLLERIYFRSPLDNNPEPWFRRLFRWLVLRPLSFLVGRDYLLLAELNTLHTARMDQMAQVMDQIIQAINQTSHRVKLLETLIGYEGQ